MNPSARVTMTTTAQSMNRLHIYNHGEDPRVINEGDLLIVSENMLREAGQKAGVEFELTIRGRDMFIFQSHVEKAMRLWNENKDYLTQPVSRIITPSLNTASILDGLRRQA